MPHIDNIQKFIYVHIPKCGGNSIKEALGLEGHDHRGIVEVNGDISNYFKFTFVRNPWDRFVSGYEYLKQGGIRQMLPDTNWDDYFENRVNFYPSFKEFVKSKEWVSSGWLHFTPQYDFINISNNICMDFIGKVENMQDDYDTICKAIGLKSSVLKRTNRSKRRNYEEYFDDESRKIIAEEYEKDIKYFDYSFGTPI